MRTLPLLLTLVAALGTSGCSFGECSFESIERSFDGVTVVAEAAPAPDTLTVAFVGDRYGTQRLLRTGDVPFTASGDGLQVALDARYVGVGEPAAAPTFGTVVRGDTVFVRRTDADALVRRVCSPAAPSLALTITSLRVPAGVRAARVVSLDAYDPTVPPLPVARPLHGPRPALLTA